MKKERLIKIVDGILRNELCAGCEESESEFETCFQCVNYAADEIIEILKNLISKEDVVEECKLEFLNPEVERETEKQTLIDQSFARGWNEANRNWIIRLNELPFNIQAGRREKK